MISIPIWLFVLLVILASLAAIAIILTAISVIMLICKSEVRIPEYYYPEELDPDYNPEYIPKDN